MCINAWFRCKLDALMGHPPRSISTSGHICADHKDVRGGEVRGGGEGGEGGGGVCVTVEEDTDRRRAR